jgi:Polyketide cyclase / dehydrase and lipid transport
VLRSERMTGKRPAKSARLCPHTRDAIASNALWENAMAEQTFSVERSITINAPASAVHERLNNFHKWVDWSPWEGLDPALQRTYTGPDSGVGASYAWTGTRKVGQGRMEITESTPNRVALDLHFIKPFKANNKTVFAITPAGEGTNVTWTMTGPKTLLSKLMGIFMSMDKLVGKDFDKGLASLKRVTEAA